jgi:hypothetical protein
VHWQSDALTTRLDLIQFYLGSRSLYSYQTTVIYIIQGGSDISGTLSKLHRRIKKSTFLLIILR